MASSGMLRRVALVGTDISEELSASSIRVTRIGELGTTLPVTISLQRVSVASYSCHTLALFTNTYTVTEQKDWCSYDDDISLIKTTKLILTNFPPCRNNEHKNT
jgi:hypothetical protein